MNGYAALKNSPYVSLATFRKTGAQVATPVWCAGEAEELFVFSEPQAGKIKRLRNSQQAKLATCDVRGKVLGPWFDASAVIIENPEEVAHALAILRKKYGWQMWLLDLGSKVTGKFHKRAYIKIRVSEPQESL